MVGFIYHHKLLQLIPITRFDIDFKNSFIGRTVRLRFSQKQEIIYIRLYDPYLAEQDGPNVAPITVTAGKYIGSF
jgi:hypothetical protein